MFELDNKVALVTGGTSGIGAAICTLLAARGARVATNYRNAQKATVFQQQAKEAGYMIATYQADVTDYAACEDMCQKISEDLGPIDILVNNAGITKDGMFKKMTRETWDAVIDINLNGLFNVTRQTVNSMSEKAWGRIINISSINGQKGQLGQTNYAATKAGIHGFTMSLAQEMARKGVTVNTISPGYIGTDMVMQIAPEIREKITKQIPVGRLGKTDEVAALVLYLCSDESGFVTGADFAINGGQHMM